MGYLTATAILADFRARGARLHVAGDRVHVDGVRPDDLPPELVAAAREHRAELLDELHREAKADELLDQLHREAAAVPAVADQTTDNLDGRTRAQRRESIIALAQDVFGSDTRVVAPLPAAPTRLAEFAPVGTAPTGIAVWRCRRCGGPTCAPRIHGISCPARRHR